MTPETRAQVVERLRNRVLQRHPSTGFAQCREQVTFDDGYLSGLNDLEVALNAVPDAREPEAATMASAAIRASAELRHAYRAVACGQSIDPELVARAIRILERATTPTGEPVPDAREEPSAEPLTRVIEHIDTYVFEDELTDHQKAGMVRILRGAIPASQPETALRAALWRLANEATGFLALTSSVTHGVTNMRVLQLRIDEARAALTDRTTP